MTEAVQAKLPKTLKVLGRTVKVLAIKDLADAAGQWHSAKYQIDVCKDQEPLDEADTLLHETMHAILHCQGREDGGDVEEAYIRALATGLLMVLRQNPKFVRYLMQGIEF